MAGCDDADAHEAKRAASKALDQAKRGYGKAEKGVRKGYDKAEKGVLEGYDKAKARIDGIDWVQAFESTKDTIDQASNALEAPTDPGPADAWWNRGADAVECTDSTCTVAPWFVREARSNPARLMGDVKVFTAPDDSGWLLGEVRTGSAAHSMGFRAGDVVRTIGGHPLTDKLARLEILAALRKAEEVQTTFVRNGETKVSTLTIRFASASG